MLKKLGHNYRNPCSKFLWGTVHLRKILNGGNLILIETSHLLACWFLAELNFFDPEDGGDMFLQNVSRHSTDYTALYPRIWYSS
jgi:hypothetical protein